MKKTIASLALWFAVCTIVLGCSNEPAREYLEATIAPCAPILGVDADPCRPAEDSETDGGNADALTYAPMPEVPPAMRDFLDDGLENEYYDTQIVFRGTALPGSGRCDEAPDVAWAGHGSDWQDVIVTRATCYMDFRVSDYLWGTGPPLLTLGVEWANRMTWPGGPIGGLSRTESEMIANSESELAGIEMVHFARLPMSAAVTALFLEWVWPVHETKGQLDPPPLVL